MLEKQYVIEKLKWKKSLDRRANAFGAGYHRYQIRQPIKENKLVNFEKKYSITLPTDYRSYLINVSNGGPGPGYGFLSLEDTEKAIEETYDYDYNDVVKYEKTDVLAQPFNIHSEFEVETGYITICEHGCQFEDYLIVTGSERGNIWMFDDIVGAVPYSIEALGVKKLDYSNFDEAMRIQDNNSRCLISEKILQEYNLIFGLNSGWSLNRFL